MIIPDCQAIDDKAMTFLRVANAVIPHMREAGSGRIVGISGQNALMTGSVTAAVRNAALSIAAQSLADDLAGTGIAINVVNPGPVTERASVSCEPASMHSRTASASRTSSVKPKRVKSVMRSR